MQTPRPKYFCPSCRTSFHTEQNFCGRCGADMRRVSGLDYSRPNMSTAAASGRGKKKKKKKNRAFASTQQADAIDSWDEESSDLERSDAFRGRARSGDHDRWLGTIVDNRYRVIEVVGRGGMGVVYRVEHLRMGKIAAMKVLHHDLAAEAEVSRRFRIEAEAVSRLTHPNTVQVFDFGTAKGALYLVMEFVRGRDIGSIIDRDGPMSLDRAAPLFGQIASALGEAHELGVVHRDLKPENILVTRTHGGHDFVKVLDFGLAKLGEREELAEETGRGAIVGTPYYMSPEQIRADSIDARADIYSLGALMYRVLTGEPPFRANSPVGVLTKHLTEPLIPPTERRPDLDLPDAIDAVIGRAMAKDRDDRFDTVGDLSAAIADVYEAGSSGRISHAWQFPGAKNKGVNQLAEDIDYGIDTALRLKRSDLDRYEMSLKRRHWVRLLAIPVALAALGAAVFYYFSYVTGQPLSAENEPNNSLSDTDLIAIDSAVAGTLGKRISPSEADKDFYRVDPGDTDKVSVEVSALPNIDVSLFVYDLNGKILKYANEGSLAAGESIDEVAVSGPFVIMVTEAREVGDKTLPTENVSDSYRLTVRSR